MHFSSEERERERERGAGNVYEKEKTQLPDKQQGEKSTEKAKVIMKAASAFALAFALCAALAAAGTTEEGLKYLEENKGKEGVVTLASGLQYKVIKKGAGGDHPTVDSPCLCHYEGTLINGDVFDSSYSRGSPTTFAPNQVIKGWTEAMQLMVEGDKFELYIPSELAYGDRGSPPKIPGGSVLIFTIEIIEIKGGRKPAFKCTVDNLDACSDREVAYVAKAQKKFAAPDALSAEIERLRRLSNSKTSPEKKNWMGRRLHILSSMTTLANEEL